MANHLPLDHRMGAVYRVGGAVVGVVLVVFGVLAYLANRDDVLARAGSSVVGLQANGVLGIVSAVLGVLAILGALIGSNTSSSTNLVVGVVLILLGTIGLCVIRTPEANIFGFAVRTVIAFYIAGLLAANFGLYGRVSGGRPKNADTTGRHPLSPLEH